jgi:hypothetical protein
VTGLPAAFDLPAGQFPFLLELIDTRTGEPWWSVVVEGPGVLSIPAAPPSVRGFAACRVTLPDGTRLQ